MKLLTTIAVLALALSATAAGAATEFKFAYTSTVNTIKGRLTGDLQGDGKTVIVSAVRSTNVDGTPGPETPFVYSSDAIYGVPEVPATVTLDGSAMNLFACTEEFCPTEGFSFDTTLLLDVFPFVSNGGFFGDYREEFVPAQWSISAIPEPASWGLMLSGFGLVGAAARRRLVIDAAA